MSRVWVDCTEPYSAFRSFVTGHAPMVLHARTNGGVQTVLAQWRDATQSDVFWFRLTPLHPNIVIGQLYTSKHVIQPSGCLCARGRCGNDRYPVNPPPV